MESKKALWMSNTPIRATEIARMLEEGSQSLALYLGEEVYFNADADYIRGARARLAATARLHAENVGDKPTILLRAPGRLNAFLEYLDMCAGDHMSTTIDGDHPVCISFREDDLVRAFNFCKEFDDREFSIGDEARLLRSAPWKGSACEGLPDNWDNRTRIYPHYDRPRGDWVNYIKASFMRIAWEAPALDLHGVDMTFGESTIPRRAGTSSSSAVVVLAFLAAYLANTDRLPEWSIRYICKLMGEAEWYVGTHGGANDHTTILRNFPNCVLYNRYTQAEPDSTVLPSLKGVKMIVANSLWEANKSLNANHVFNLRKGWMDLGDDLMKAFISAICECLGSGLPKRSGWISDVLKNRFGIDVDNDLVLLESDSEFWTAIRGNYKKFGSLDETILGIPNQAIDELISILPEQISATHAGLILGKDASAMERDYTLPDPDEGGYRTRAAATFFHKENKIGRTLETLLFEADSRLQSGQITLDSPEYERYQIRVGWILEELQDGLRDDFEVSNSQLDMLLDIASRAPGYLGGKLTGAGCGGCVVVMVREGSQEAFCDYLDQVYYGEPANFETYRRRLSELALAIAKEMLGNLDGALSNIKAQRRVVTFSAGAGVVDLTKCFSTESVPDGVTV